MNRVLAETLSAVNGIIALVIVLAGTYIGYKTPFGGIVAIFLGAGLGAIVAALVCGTISYLALIEGHLAKIANHKPESNPDYQRREPSL